MNLILTDIIVDYQELAFACLPIRLSLSLSQPDVLSCCMQNTFSSSDQDAASAAMVDGDAIEPHPEVELDPAQYPLHAAAVSADVPALAQLLNHVGGPHNDPNALCPNGRSALVYAIHGGNRTCIDVLLESGADVNLADATGMTALQWATSQSHSSMVK